MNIVILGNRQIELPGVLHRTFSKYGAVLTTGDGALHCEASRAGYNIFCVTHPLKIDIPGCLVIFNTNDICPFVSINSDALCIVDSGDAHALSLLKKSGNTAVCCGMSSKDTFCISSLDEGSAVVSLMRHIDIPPLSFDPGDITVTLTCPTPAFSILCASASLLLSGISSENGFFV